MTEAHLYLPINEGESPLEALIRAAEPYGLTEEVTESYKFFLTEGRTPDEAAFFAADEWDLLSLHNQS